ncbi:DUF4136 domain-containing protein [Silvimonas iriomotensis]|uniref:DUF4136 domain-containing protein n=1 Tax=Silvimonas iriomotensis TaxID=449662 RepID=A0ABQ2P3Z4_9NEIS|nr:DUF4136 domain-containing protein [Silvimonas iriomotensis]GGP17513.1 hypothetical protein GCM10010970_00020 [Silvimonas iriomotensis]
MKCVSLLVLVLALGVLAGCATRPPEFVAQVTVRHTLASAVAGKQFAFARPAPQSQSLLDQAAEQQVAHELSAAGLVEADNAQHADWLVALNYGVDNGQIVVTQEPVWGTVGYASYYGWYPGPYGGRMFVPGWYAQPGIVGTQSIQSTVYTRFLTVDISDRVLLEQGRFAKLYEGKAINHSETQDLDAALPWLTRALFQSFPGFSGTTTTVRLILPQPAPH